VPAPLTVFFSTRMPALAASIIPRSPPEIALPLIVTFTLWVGFVTAMPKSLSRSVFAETATVPRPLPGSL
jgi:hypothetical protein